ncbi:hypothetical protein FA95DRAFT_853926 [Auriscalpium vulgare]|uniref:Uncharacterized protein n=1 Tax=Auriscalpium vulgare TaxID=40419 RepID=A0ACB8R8Y9_9AGAM|nr:hypothetical protein FA95DRAFT_853926 [Auriscalpium vulgare]
MRVQTGTRTGARRLAATGSGDGRAGRRVATTKRKQRRTAESRVSWADAVVVGSAKVCGRARGAEPCGAGRSAAGGRQRTTRFGGQRAIAASRAPERGRERGQRGRGCSSGGVQTRHRHVKRPRTRTVNAVTYISKSAGHRYANTAPYIGHIWVICSVCGPGGCQQRSGMYSSYTNSGFLVRNLRS